MPYQIDSTVSECQTAIEVGMGEIEAAASCVDFVERTGEDEYARKKLKGSDSYGKKNIFFKHRYHRDPP